jgi:hypothetical protein
MTDDQLKQLIESNAKSIAALFDLMAIEREAISQTRLEQLSQDLVKTPEETTEIPSWRPVQMAVILIRQKLFRISILNQSIFSGSISSSN